MKHRCFVCMPLIDDTQCIYNEIEQEIRATLGGRWQCAKANDTRAPGTIEERFVKSILNANLVIAVVADPREGNPINPNVMYELGIAHSFRKPTIVIADIRNALPFNIRGVETIQLDFSSPAVLPELRKALQCSLQDPEFRDDMESRRIPRNPITNQLSRTQIFIEDLPWLWGYCEVFRREREAQTVWEISRELFWPGEEVFFENLKEGIRKLRKHYFMVEDDPGVLRKIEAIRRDLQQEIAKNELDKLLHFVAIDAKYFVLWPIAVVLYDADRVKRRGGIICEPMQALVGMDSYDDFIRKLFLQYAKSGNLDAFEEALLDIDWTKRREEATFDISLDGRVVEALSTSFAEIWNNKILEEAQQKSGDEKSALLNTWVIGG